MTQPSQESSQPLGAAIVARPSAVGPSVAIAGLIALAVIVQLANPGVTDVGWLFVVCERLLAGERLYVDVLEVNPPASVFIYLPFAWLGARLQVAPEHLLLGGLLAAATAGMWISGRILDRAGLIRSPSAWAVAGGLAFMVLPGNSFGQREHVALVLMLPMLALAAARALPAWRISALAAVAIGTVAGGAVCIKPHFAAAILLPQLYAAWRSGSFRVLFSPENWALGTTAVVYAAATVAFFPEYFSDMLPVVLEVYRPSRTPLHPIAELVLPFVLLMGLYLASPGQSVGAPTRAVPLLAAAGFLLGYFEQSKGWQYHYYPTVALLVFVVLRDLVEVPPFRTIRRWSLQAMRLAAAASLILYAAERFRPYTQVSSSLEPVIQRLSPRPTLLAITGDLGVTNPLTRRVNGIWVGRLASLWISELAHLLLSDPDITAEKRAVLHEHIARDRAMFMADLRGHAPDVLLIDVRGGSVDWKAWAGADQDFAGMLAAYKLEAWNVDVELYVRRSRP